MRLKTSLIAALCLILLPINGCKKKQVENGVTYRPDNFPEILVPPENATDVRYSNPKVYKPAAGYFYLYYHVVEEYPPEETIEQMRNDLKMKGCIEIGPGSWRRWRSKKPSSPGWEVNFTWMDAWTTPSDDLVENQLSYKETERRKHKKLLVIRTITPDALMHRLDAPEYEELHLELFEVRR